MQRPKLAQELNQTTKDALNIFKGLLQGKKLSIDNPVFQHVMVFITRPSMYNLPENEKDNLRYLIKSSFNLSEMQLLEHMSGITSDEMNVKSSLDSKSHAQIIEDQLWTLLPRGGFLEQYANYTLNSEAPLAYHVFCALVAVGLIVNRKVWFHMGHYRLYPPLAIFLLGPSGLRKTSAANIMLKLVQDIEITKVYPEKLTPEVLVGAVKDNPQGLLYAPEMASTLGKQKYMEGIIPLITRLQDCPDVYLAETIGRGKELLTDVAISILMCSTPDWFISNTPTDTFGGGFIARNIMVMQTDTPREEDIPDGVRGELKEDILMRLMELGKHMKGEMVMEPAARTYHKDWYHAHKENTKNPEHALLATYYQRKPDHMKKIAMCLHMVENYNLTMTLKSLEQAICLIDWIEQFIPPMLKTMFKTQMGESHDYVMQVIRNNGGMLRHSELVRKVQHKMDAQKLRAVLGSLKEAEQLKEVSNALQHVYMLREVR